jgi:ankyrin repeat protein
MLGIHSQAKPVISVFIGGPQEVQQERHLAEHIVDKYFRRTYQNNFYIDVFTWDGKYGRAAQVGEVWQKSIEERSDPGRSHIAIFIFKWRLGSPDRFEGKEYPSRSARELEVTLNSDGKPKVALFRYAKPPEPIVVDEDLEESEKIHLREEKKQRPVEYRRLGTYLQALALQYDDKNFNINPFNDIDDLERQLIDILHEQFSRILIDLSARRAPVEGRTQDWPFRGMDELQLDDENIFYGREVETRELLRRFSADPQLKFLCIYGASGTGKSSLMRAGLLPKLIRNQDQTSKNDLNDRVVLLFKPSDQKCDPFLALADGIRSQPGTPIARSEPVAKQIRDACVGDWTKIKHALDHCLVARMAASDHEIILAVDQLEELWTAVPAEHREPFLKFLSTAAGHDRCRVIVTIRNDSYHELTNVEALSARLSHPNSTFLLLPALGEQIGRMIRDPLKLAGIVSEDVDALVLRILQDSEELGAAALPLIAHTLREMRLGPNRFTVGDYEQVGGVKQAIRYSIDQALDVLKGRMMILDTLFENLVTFASGSPERVSVAISDLEAAGVDRAGVIEKLVACRVLRVSQGDQVELAHQALFSAWPELKLWLGDAATERATLALVEKDARVWHENGRQYKDIRLGRAAAESIQTAIGDRGSGRKERSIVKQYIDAALAEQQREKLIISIKGGHVTDALDALRAGAKLRPDDRGNDWDKLWPALYAAVTGDDKPPADRGTGDGQIESVFDDPDEFKRVTSRNMTSLNWAAVFGHLDLVKNLVSRGADPKRLSSLGESVLFDAAYAGHLEVVRYLVEDCNVDPHITDSKGSSAISWAFQQKHDAIVQYLQMKGVPLQFSGKDGWNLLTEAVRRGTLDTVKDLVEAKGYDVNHRTKGGWSSLSIACERGTTEHIEILKYLVERGASLEARSDEGWSSLHVAATTERLPVMTYLLENGVDINIKDNFGVTPLQAAADSGKVSSVKFLVARGADLDAVNSFGATAVIAAVVQRQNQIVAALLKAGADPNLFRENVWPILHYIADDGDAALLEVVLSRAERLDVNATVHPGWTALMIAARKGHLNIVRRLLDLRKGNGDVVTDVTVVDAGKQDALSIAFAHGHQDVVDYIKRWIQANRRWNSGQQEASAHEMLKRQGSLERGTQRMDIVGLRSRNLRVLAGREEEVEDENDLIRAADAGDLQRVKESLKGGADVSSPGYFGRTALHAAAKSGSIEVIDELLHAEPDLNRRDRLGITAVETADQFGQFAAVERLVAAGAIEPAYWHKPRVSDVARFLSFAEMSVQEAAAFGRSIASAEGLVIPEQYRRYRAARLPCYENVRLVAIEDLRRKGQREQFALQQGRSEPTLMDWTNEPVYAFNERNVMRLEGADALTYTRFFFHFVRGVLGRFTFVETEEEIAWTPEATDKVRRETASKLIPLKVVDRIGASQTMLRGSVIFKNALFYTSVRVATEKTLVDPVADDDEEEESMGSGAQLPPEQFAKGQMRLENEELIAEELPIEVDGPPGIFG